MANYTAKIIESSKELTKREELILCDTSNAEPIDKLVAEGEFTIKPKDYAIVHVECDKSETGEYDVLVITDYDNRKYRTGSDSFRNAFINIYNAMKDTNEDYEISVYSLPSRNFSGNFLTCSII